MHDMSVRHEEADRYSVKIRGHEIVVDQPGSGDAGPTPTELFVAGLASCVAFYAGRFLARHGIEATGLAVDCSFEMAEGPARVSKIGLDLRLPASFPAEKLDRLMAVVEHCTVHNSLVVPPFVQIATSDSST